MAARLCFFVSLCLLLSFCFATENEALTQRDNENIAKKLGPFLDGSSSETRYALGAFHLLKQSIPNQDSVCSKLQKALKKADEVDEIYNLVQSLIDAGCSVSLSADAEKTLFASASPKSTTFLPVFQSVATLLALKEKNSIKSDLSQVNWSGLVNFFVERIDDDVAVASAALQIGLVYQSLGQIHSLAPIDTTTKKTIAAAAQRMEDLFLLVNEDGVFSATKVRSALTTNALILQGVSTFAAATQTSSSVHAALPAQQMESWSRFFLSAKFGQATAEDLYSVALGLSLCADNAIEVPLVLQLEAASFPARLDASHRLLVTLTSTLGVAPSVRHTISLTKLTPEGQTSSSLLSNPVGLTSDSQGTKFQLPLQAAIKSALTPGFYIATFTVQPLDSKLSQFKTLTFEKRIKFMSAGVRSGAVAIIPAESNSFDTALKRAKAYRAKFPQAHASVIDVEKEYHFLHIAFNLTADVQFKQVFVQITTPDNDKHIFIPKTVSSQYILTLDLGSKNVVKKLSTVGTYGVQVLVGDSLLQPSDASAWKIADVELDLSDAAASLLVENGQAATIRMPAPPPAAFYDTAKPQILHEFRSAEARAPLPLALLFTLVILAPLGLALLALRRLGIQIEFPAAGSQEYQYAALFQGSILLMLVLILLYWICLPLSTAIVSLSLSAVMMYFFGHKYFSMHAKVKSA
eukprot:TRINITY_DN1571_c0_g1_i6.p1 TRINITY_DN1571_c0_g1~~TRINITY_DN1571_c0_g1_i6.p1  ORF type:complete len:691 (-),score=303.34 TRINITY_DN1571_c0_g1_i6:195-2267(-)